MCDPVMNLQRDVTIFLESFKLAERKREKVLLAATTLGAIMLHHIPMEAWCGQLSC